jgi:hypothetical protein
VADKAVDTNPKCGGCLWYGTPSDDSELGACRNAESAYYWNPGVGSEVVRIAPDAESCRYYKSARTFFGEDSRVVRWWDSSLIASFRSSLCELFCPLVLTVVFLYYAFRSSPERYHNVYTRTEREELSL